MNDANIAMAKESLHRGIKEGETMHVECVLTVGGVRVRTEYELAGDEAVDVADSFLRSLTPTESGDA